MLPIATSIGWYSFPTVELEADGQRFEAHWQWSSMCHATALGLRLCPDALPDDGWLDWVVFARPGTVRLAVYAAAVRWATPAIERCRYGRCGRLWLRSPTRVPLRDGEAAEFTPIEIGVEPLALRIVTD